MNNGSEGTPASADRSSPFGWIDLGRFFIFLAAFELLFGGLASIGFTAAVNNPEMMLTDLAALIVPLPIFFSLYFSLRPRGRAAWMHLGFRGCRLQWIAASALGWTAIVVICIHVLAPLGAQAFPDRGLFQGVFHDRQPPIYGGLSSLSLAKLLLPLGIVVSAEIAYRGLVLNALLNAWSARFALPMTVLLSATWGTFHSGVGVVAGLAVGLFGAILNGWLMIRTRSIWPGLIGVIGFVVYFWLFLDRP